MLTTTLKLLGQLPGQYHCSHKLRINCITNNFSWSEDDPIELANVLKICGLSDALLALYSTEKNCDYAVQEMAFDVARAALPVWLLAFPADSSAQYLLQTARKFALRTITENELSEAINNACIALSKGYMFFSETCNTDTTNQLSKTNKIVFLKSLRLMMGYLWFVNTLLSVRNQNGDEHNSRMHMITFMSYVKSANLTLENEVKEIFLRYVQ